MINLLARRLEGFNPLAERDRAILDDLIRDPVRLRPGRDLFKEGDNPTHVHVLLEGWAYRYKVTSEGRRQIVAVLLPGDLCDPHVFILDRMDHSMGLLSGATVARVPKEVILDITERSPAIGRALWWSALVDEAILRHWLLNIGQRSALDRIAHLFCELHERAKQVGLVTNDAFELPLTQEQLGDTVGLTPVHTNRMLQRLRSEGLIEFEGRRLLLPDMAAIRKIADFDPRYLHQKRRN